MSSDMPKPSQMRVCKGLGVRVMSADWVAPV